MIKYVMDASSILAVLNQETGADKVTPLLATSALSTVNLAEVGTKLIASGMSEIAAEIALNVLGIASVVNFDADLAWETARLRPLTRHAGLSLGDRACLALARKRGLVAVTADKEWAKLNLCQILLIR